jgi:lysylphosphatidylglycerol synthetase-like protein (DUF2156 family)
MKPSIAKEHASGEPWSIPMAALVGFMVGIFLATFRHFSHDHPGFTPTTLVEHFFPCLIATVSICALMFALAAAFHNRLMRKR